MTDTSQKQVANNDSKSKAPTHIAFHVREDKEGGRDIWTCIGSAWAHKDGKGFDIEMGTMLIDGRIILLMPE